MQHHSELSVKAGDAVVPLDEDEHGVDKHEDWSYVRRLSDGAHGHVVARRCRVSFVSKQILLVRDKVKRANPLLGHFP